MQNASAVALDKNCWDFPVTMRNVYFQDATNNFKHIQKRMATIREDTNEILGVVSQKYKIIHNKEFAERADEMVGKELIEFGTPTVINRIIDNGARFERKYIFKDVNYKIVENCFEDNKTPDTSNPVILFKNSYDGSWSYLIEYGVFRVSCSNGLIIGKSMFRYSKTHVTNPNKSYGEGFELLKQATNTFSEATNLWKKWADTVIEQKEKEDLIKEINMGKKNTELFEQQYSSATQTNNNIATRWILWNILMAITTHSVTKANRQIALNNRIGNIIYNKWND